MSACVSRRRRRVESQRGGQRRRSGIQAYGIGPTPPDGRERRKCKAVLCVALASCQYPGVRTKAEAVIVSGKSRTVPAVGVFESVTVIVTEKTSRHSGRAGKAASAAQKSIRRQASRPNE